VNQNWLLCARLTVHAARLRAAQSRQGAEYDVRAVLALR
jgi:hypothetical protein